MKHHTPNKEQYLCPEFISCAVNLERGFANSSGNLEYDGFSVDNWNNGDSIGGEI